MTISEIATGDVGTYHEDGGVSRVKVLETTHDAAGTRVVFEVVEVLIPGPFVIGDARPKPGQRFDTWAAHDAGPHAGWSFKKGV